MGHPIICRTWTGVSRHRDWNFVPFDIGMSLVYIFYPRVFRGPISMCLPFLQAFIPCLSVWDWRQVTGLEWSLSFFTFIPFDELYCSGFFRNPLGLIRLYIRSLCSCISVGLIALYWKPSFLNFSSYDHLLHFINTYSFFSFCTSHI